MSKGIQYLTNECFDYAATRNTYIRLPGNLKWAHPVYRKTDIEECITEKVVSESSWDAISRFKDSWNHTDIKDHD